MTIEFTNTLGNVRNGAAPWCFHAQDAAGLLFATLRVALQNKDYTVITDRTFGAALTTIQYLPIKLSGARAGT